MYTNNLLDFEVHLTTRCNMMCEFCGAEVLRTNELYEIDLDSVKGLIFDAKKAGNKRITFSGGEPFLVKELREMIQFALDHGFMVNVSTNGLLIDEEYAKFVSNKKVSTRISLHSLQHDKFKSITKTDTLDQVIKALEILKEHKAYYSLTATVYDKNVEDIFELGDFAHKYAATSIRFTPVFPTNLGRQYYASTGTIYKMLLYTAQLVLKYYDDIDVKHENKNANIIIADIMTTRHCLAQEKRFAVFTAHKTDKPCPFYPEDDELQIPDKCSDCLYLSVCQGGCIGLNVNTADENEFKCIREILHQVLSQFNEQEQQKLCNYWKNIYNRYSYSNYSTIGCIRKLPIWEVVFNEQFLRRARYAN